MILTIRPATVADAEWLGLNLREEDRVEVQTATGMAASAVVPASLAHSRECYTVRQTSLRGGIEDNPFVIFGVYEDSRTAGVGIVWMLATDAIKKSPISFFREAKHWIDSWQTRYPHGLHNIVDARNDLHLRWLQLLGFTLGETHTVNGFPFVHAIRRSNNV